MQKLAYRTDATVSEMVDVVNITYLMRKSEEIVYACENIVKCNVIRNKNGNIIDNCLFKLFFIGKLFHYAFKHFKAYLFINACFVELG